MTANADAFATESDKKWFILSHMTKGAAAGIVEWIKGDMRKNFDGKAYETFVDVLDGLLASSGSWITIWYPGFGHIP